MKRPIPVTCLILILAAATLAGSADAPVVVTSVREVGISPSDETKSVIEIKWSANPALIALPDKFRLHLVVTYADGSTIVETRVADPEATAVLIEVPSTKLSGRNPPAAIKSLRAVAVTQKRRR